MKILWLASICGDFMILFKKIVIFLVFLRQCFKNVVLMKGVQFSFFFITSSVQLCLWNEFSLRMLSFSLRWQPVAKGQRGNFPHPWLSALGRGGKKKSKKSRRVFPIPELITTCCQSRPEREGRGGAVDEATSTRGANCGAESHDGGRTARPRTEREGRTMSGTEGRAASGREEGRGLAVVTCGVASREQTKKARDSQVDKGGSTDGG
jgi:hypothetical protein